jgi:hypothetical protein
MAAFTGPADVSNHGQLWRDPGAAKVDHVHGSVNRNPLCGDKGPSLIVTAARCLMTDITLPAGRFAEGDFSIGRVFGRAWSVFSGNFATFVLVTATSGLPSFLIQQAAPDTLGNTYADVGMAVFATIVMLGFWTLSQAIVLYGAFQVMRGRPIDLVGAARIGSRRALSIVGLAIAVPVLCFLAALLFIVPGVILYLVWFVATPVCVVERLGVFRSMGRSAELTNGFCWRILGLQLVILISVFVIGSIASTAAPAILGAAGASALAASLDTTLGQVVNMVWNAIWTAFYAIVVAVTYHDLRVAKEGVDTEQIAAVFA